MSFENMLDVYFDRSPTIIDQKITKLINEHGIKNVLESIINDIEPHIKEEYLLELKIDLKRALKNYNNRYED